MCNDHAFIKYYVFNVTECYTAIAFAKWVNEQAVHRKKSCNLIRMYFSLDYSLSLLTEMKNYYSTFFFNLLYWSIKNQFIPLKLLAVVECFFCMYSACPVQRVSVCVCDFLCIPICMLIRYQTIATAAAAAAATRGSSTHYCCCCWMMLKICAMWWPPKLLFFSLLRMNETA